MSRATATAFSLERYLFFQMTRAIHARDRALASELKYAGLRVPDWRILAILHARRQLSMSALAQIASIDRTTLTRTVDRMEHTGWLARLGDPKDLRVILLSVTSAGESLFNKVWPAVARVNDLTVAGLPPGAAEFLGWALDRMTSNLQRAAADSEGAA